MTSRYVLIALLSFGLLVAALVWVHAPIRAKNLTAKYEAFRAEHQAEHDAIDAQFNQHHAVVNGMQWHYVEAGNPNGKAILILQADSDPQQPLELFADVPERCPRLAFQILENASHFSNLDQPEAMADAINRFIHLSEE